MLATWSRWGIVRCEKLVTIAMTGVKRQVQQMKTGEKCLIHTASEQSWWLSLFDSTAPNCYIIISCNLLNKCTFFLSIVFFLCTEILHLLLIALVKLFTAVLLKTQYARKLSRGLVKCRFWFSASTWRCGLLVYKLPGNADAAGPQTTLSIARSQGETINKKSELGCIFELIE